MGMAVDQTGQDNAAASIDFLNAPVQRQPVDLTTRTDLDDPPILNENRSVLN